MAFAATTPITKATFAYTLGSTFRTLYNSLNSDSLQERTKALLNVDQQSSKAHNSRGFIQGGFITTLLKILEENSVYSLTALNSLYNIAKVDPPCGVIGLLEARTAFHVRRYVERNGNNSKAEALLAYLHVRLSGLNTVVDQNDLGDYPPHQRIPFLLQNLRCGTENAMRNALEDLVVLCNRDLGNAKEIFQADGVKFLSELFNHPCESVRLLVASLISSLALIPCTRETIAKAQGVVTGCVYMIGDHQPLYERQPASLILSLIATNKASWPFLIVPYVMNTIISLLFSVHNRTNRPDDCYRTIPDNAATILSLLVLHVPSTRPSLRAKGIVALLNKYCKYFDIDCGRTEGKDKEKAVHPVMLSKQPKVVINFAPVHVQEALKLLLTECR